MLETLTALPPVHQAFLVLVVTGFSLFAVTLGSVHAYVNLKK